MLSRADGPVLGCHYRRRTRQDGEWSVVRWFPSLEDEVQRHQNDNNSNHAEADVPEDAVLAGRGAGWSGRERQDNGNAGPGPGPGQGPIVWEGSEVSRWQNLYNRKSLKG